MTAQRPKMCPSCGKLMGLERVCPYCGADSGALKTRLAAAATRGPSGNTWVTLGFVLVNLLLYLVAMLLGGQQPADQGIEILQPDRLLLVRMGMQVPQLVELGEWWRLVMPIFLHMGLLHVAMNTWVLWSTGRGLERDVGGPAFFVMYMVAGVLGFVASQVADIGGAGASGAVSGVLGCTIAYRWLVDRSFGHPDTQMALRLVLMTAVFGMVVSHVNNVAHLFGFLAGAALGWPMARFTGRVAARVWFAAAVACAGLAVTAVLMTVLNQPPEWRAEVMRAVRCHDMQAEAIDDKHQTVWPGPALAMIRCLESVGPMDATGNAQVAAIERALFKTREGRLSGSRRAELEGYAETKKALYAFKVWVESDYRLTMP